MPLSSLKQLIIDNLSRDKYSLDKPYLHVGGNLYTKQQLIDEIRAETELGEDMMAKLIGLTIDLLNRKKIPNH